MGLDPWATTASAAIPASEESSRALQCTLSLTSSEGDSCQPLGKATLLQRRYVVDVLPLVNARQGDRGVRLYLERGKEEELSLVGVHCPSSQRPDLHTS